MTTIRAAVLNAAPGQLDLETLTLDGPNANEVTVRIAHAGLCHSDLHEIDGVWDTILPIVLGHEAAGIVEAVGSDVVDIRVGDHVVCCVSVACGRCRYCTNGQLTLCPYRSDVQARSGPRLVNAAGSAVRPTAGLGAFAEAMVVHQNALVVLPREMPLDKASILGCAIVTGLGAVFRSARVRPGSSVAVIGCGGIGLAAIQGARLAGAARIIAIDVVGSKLAMASTLGATDQVNASSSDAVEAVRDLTGGGVEYSFEAIGRSLTVEQAFAMLAPGGRATVIGLVPDTSPLTIKASDLFINEKVLTGSFMGSNQFRVDIPSYVEMYLQGRLLLDEMVSDHVSLDNINQGFNLLRSGSAMRVVADIGI
jgi:S-(hydroxymethyl)glutathione dehydrogenase / alcohol dehydrogenase